jgi:hypothetical protein
LIRSVRDWLSNQLTGRGIQIPGSSQMLNRYNRFRAQLPSLCRQVHLNPSEITFNEHRRLVIGWLHTNPW